jgi:2-polyprenyl-3-methyl-5-hydroxy-6-metoxy-1,4-benzoquinol methylase
MRSDPVAFDPYNRTSELGEAALTAMADRLESRGRDPAFIRMLDDYLAAMDAGRLSLVLDAGCGTGVAARRLARLGSFAGRIVGIDRSPDLIAVARQQAAAEGLADRIDLRVGDAAALGELNGRFDAAIAHTLVSHVDNPLAVVRAIAACVRPGGTIAFFDGDFASWTYGGANPAAGRELAEAAIAAIVTNPNVMREFPAIAREAGLQVVATKAYVLSEVGKASYFEASMAAYPALLPLAGRIDVATVERLIAVQRRNSAEGTFFGAINFYAYLLRRPG